ncbi:MAG: LysR substrate-binding domain-containing protein [Myxococcota bacterium]
MDQFAALRAFVLVVQDMSFTNAARRASVAPSSLTRQVNALERDLGVALLHRSTRRLDLTEAGARYFDSATRILEELEEANREVSETSPKGTLRVSLPVSFGRLHVAPFIAGFLEACPGIQLDLRLTDRRVDLIDDGIDVAIRIGIAGEANLLARRLAPHRRIVCASPAYLATHGTPERPKDLEEHNCLTFMQDALGQRWRFRDPRTEQGVRVRGSVQANHSEVLREVALHGVGVALLPTWLVGEDLRSGRLEALFEGWDADPGTPDGAIHAVYLPNRRGSRRVGAFVSYLQTRFGKPPYWDETRGSRARHTE